jgi:[CysO sulfur-carrier protein]-S-L-cysteine hydrolase
VTVLRVPERIIHQMHTLAETPIECCGLLAGHGGHVTQLYPIPNELASPTRFRTDAKAMLAAQRQMREHQQDLIAVYHSHPTSDPIPSATDLAENPFGETVLSVIIGAGTVRAWRLGVTAYEPIPIVVE